MKTLTLPMLPVLIASVLMTAPTLADSAHDYDYITKVNVGEDNYLYINVTKGGNSNPINDDNCSEPWYFKSAHSLGDDRTKAQLQIALASFLSRTQVHIIAKGCTGDGRPRLHTIQLQQ
jgi:hypothetical protein